MPDLLRTAETAYPATGGSPASWAPAAVAQSDRTCVPPPDDRWLDEPVRAAVNHGRWVAVCECGSAQIASRSDRRFWCTDCRPSGWRKVEWPPDDVLAEAEAALSARPDPRARNWVPWEEAVDDVRGGPRGVGVQGVRRRSGVTEYPCKQTPGNVWYEFKAHGHTIGHSGPPGMKPRLVEEPTPTGRTLTLVDDDGSTLTALALT